MYDPNALSLVTQGIGQAGNGPRRWTYYSADPVATVAGINYITDAAAKGLRVNDIVEVTDTATPLVSDCRVTAVNTTKATDANGILAGAGDLAAGTTIGAT